MHIFHPSDAAIAKMAEIGIIATVQDHPVLLGHNQRRWWGDERAADAIPIRKLIDAGILVGGGTDGPVVPGRSVPLHVVDDDAAGAQGLRARPRARDYRARRRCTLYTINNARIMGVEKDRGSIETGKLADLAVLSQDILAVPPDDDPQDQGADDRGRRQDRAPGGNVATSIYVSRAQRSTFPGRGVVESRDP